MYCIRSREHGAVQIWGLMRALKVFEKGFTRVSIEWGVVVPAALWWTFASRPWEVKTEIEKTGQSVEGG